MWSRAGRGSPRADQAGGSHATGAIVRWSGIGGGPRGVADRMRDRKAQAGHGEVVSSARRHMVASAGDLLDVGQRRELGLQARAGHLRVSGRHVSARGQLRDRGPEPELALGCDGVALVDLPAACRELLLGARRHATGEPDRSALGLQVLASREPARALISSSCPRATTSRTRTCSIWMPWVSNVPKSERIVKRARKPLTGAWASTLKRGIRARPGPGRRSALGSTRACG